MACNIRNILYIIFHTIRGLITADMHVKTHLFCCAYKLQDKYYSGPLDTHFHEIVLL